MVTVNASTKPNDVIETTQKLRLDILSKLFEKGIPDDAGIIQLSLNVMKDCDNNALTTRKIENEENALANVGLMISENAKHIMKELTRNGVFGGGGNDLPVRTLPELAPEHKPEFVPGQMDIGIVPLNYEDFVKE